MEPIPKLNFSGCRYLVSGVAAMFFVAGCVGLLQQRLAMIYARPTALPLAAVKSPSPAVREDALLFDRALAAGLLRLSANGRIVIAPADLPLQQHYARTNPALLTPRTAEEPDWLAGVWDTRVSQIHRALHFSAAGRYVRQQVAIFNARQQWAAEPALLDYELGRIRREGERLIWQAPTASVPERRSFQSSSPATDLHG